MQHQKLGIWILSQYLVPDDFDQYPDTSNVTNAYLTAKETTTDIRDGSYRRQ